LQIANGAPRCLPCRHRSAAAPALTRQGDRGSGWWRPGSAGGRGELRGFRPLSARRACSGKGQERVWRREWHLQQSPWYQSQILFVYVSIQSSTDMWGGGTAVTSVAKETLILIPFNGIIDFIIKHFFSRCTSPPPLLLLSHPLYYAVTPLLCYTITLLSVIMLLFYTVTL